MMEPLPRLVKALHYMLAHNCSETLENGLLGVKNAMEDFGLDMLQKQNETAISMAVVLRAELGSDNLQPETYHRRDAGIIRKGKFCSRSPELVHGESSLEL
jgi:hypothetical protein